MSCHPNTERGLRVRRALLSVARACQAQGRTLPHFDRLGDALGCDGSNVSRHLKRLKREGALTLTPSGRRFHVESIRP